jgi:hypothetical protein
MRGVEEKNQKCETSRRFRASRREDARCALLEVRGEEKCAASSVPENARHLLLFRRECFT